jgi:hypothetical protein
VPLLPLCAGVCARVQSNLCALPCRDWDEDAPEKIADPSAQMPDDWDEDEDGDWEAPTIPNPKCDTGCGKWPVPMIPNPDYKGKWYAPQIDNPAYKGEWKAKQIDNPDFYEDLEPYKVRPFRYDRRRRE